MTPCCRCWGPRVSALHRFSRTAHAPRSPLCARPASKDLSILSSALLDSRIGLVNRIVSRTILRHFSSDQRAMEKLVKASDLDWTILRPPRMTDSAPQEQSSASLHDPPDAQGMQITKEEVGPRDTRNGGEWELYQEAGSHTRSAPLTLFIVFLFLAIYNTGVMTALQFQHYGIYPAVPKEGFAEYVRANNRGAVVPTIVPGMLLLLVSGVARDFSSGDHPAFEGTAAFWLNFFAIISTALWQRPASR